MVFPWPEANAVGGWWNRAFDPGIDLVGADRVPVARQLYYAGFVKWLDQPFDGRDLAGFADTAASHLALRWEPSDVVSAFT